MSDEALEPCTICKKPTQWIYNIGFKPVPICEDCADSITMQNVSYTFTNKNALRISRQG